MRKMILLVVTMFVVMLAGPAAGAGCGKERSGYAQAGCRIVAGCA